MIHRRLRITGRVQGVFYRDWAKRSAEALGIAGWVRNRPDGSVEAHVAGPQAAVDAFVAACRRGPEAARVDSVTVEAAAAEPLEGFERRRTG